MKKQFFLVGAIAIFGLSAFLVSCSKEDEWKGCTCTQIDDDGYRDKFTVSASEAKQYGATNCNQVAGLQMASGSDYLRSVNCINL